MAKFRSIKNSFLGGQISPTALARTDLPQYPHACELLQNMIPMLVGGAYSRPGTQTLGQYTTATTHPLRVIPFISSKNESYVILFKNISGTASADAYRYDPGTNAIVGGGNCTGTPPYAFRTQSTLATAIDPGLSLNAADDDVFNIQFCQSADTLFITHPLYKPQIVKRVSQDVFTINDFDYGLTGQALANAYPYLNQNTTTTAMKTSATTGNAVTLTTGVDYFVAGHVGSIFRIDDGASAVGAAIVTAFTDTKNVVAKVLVTFGDTNFHANFWESAWSPLRGWPRSCALFQQRLAMAGTLHQPDSIWFSNTANYSVFSNLNGTAPSGTVIVRGAAISVTGGYIFYPVDDSQGDGRTTGPTGSQPFRITLAQNTLDQIQWLSPDKELLVGTFSQEWIISPQNGDFSIQNSPTVIQSKYGSDYVMAQRIGYELLFPVASQDELRAYQYNYIDASFFAEPVQLLFDQYPMAETSEFCAGRRKFRHFSWDVTRQTLWCLDTAGNFFGMTRDRKLSVTMWHTHQLGGFDTTKGVNAGKGAGAGRFTDPAYALCDGSVVSFAVVPNPSSGVSDIWIVTKRSGSGTTYWQLERLIGKNITASSAYSNIAPRSSPLEPLQIDCAAMLLDNGSASNKTYSVPTTLNGYSLVGNYYSPTYGIFKITTGVVVAGSCTITSSVPADYGTATNILTLGLPFTAIIQPTRIEAGSVIGTAQGAIKRINRAFVRFYKTMFAKIGSPPTSEDLSSLETIDFSVVGAALGKSPELFTGDKKVLVPTTYDRNGYLYIVRDQPFPMTVVGIVSEGEEFDG